MRKFLSAALIGFLFLQTAAAGSAGSEGDKSPPPPPGRGDYSKMLALATSYKNGAINFAKFTQLVVAAKLPPHPLGCAYLLIPVPMPPPGVPFDPTLMPRDWEHTFGEVAMTYFAGKLSREEYDRVHAAAHRDRPGFPNCGQPLPKDSANKK
jgi:hypothetical protein